MSESLPVGAVVNPTTSGATAARKVCVQLAVGGKWVPVVPGGADILKLHAQLMTDALIGVKSPHDALTAAQTAIQQVLDKNMAGS